MDLPLVMITPASVLRANLLFSFFRRVLGTAYFEVTTGLKFHLVLYEEIYGPYAGETVMNMSVLCRHGVVQFVCDYLVI